MNNDKDKRLEGDLDFILSNKYKNSLKEFLRQNPSGGASDSTICRMIDITQDELNAIYLSAIQKLRTSLTD